MRSESVHGEPARLAGLRDRLLQGLLEAVPECRLTGPLGGRLPHHASLVFRGVKADSVLLDLDLAGIAASSGSACASLTQTPSHVLRAIGCTPAEADGSLCFTLGRWSTSAEVDTVLDRLPAIVSRLRALSAASAPRSSPHRAARPLRHRRHPRDRRGRRPPRAGTRPRARVRHDGSHRRLRLPRQDGPAHRARPHGGGGYRRRRDAATASTSASRPTRGAWWTRSATGECVRVLPGVAELLRRLDATEGVLLGLVTGNIEEGARIKLAPTGLWPYFRTGRLRVRRRGPPPAAVAGRTASPGPDRPRLPPRGRARDRRHPARHRVRARLRRGGGRGGHRLPSLLGAGGPGTGLLFDSFADVETAAKRLLAC